MIRVGYREACLEDKGDECYLCDDGEGIQVHHIDGDRGNNDLENLIPVCRSCHQKIHDGTEGYEEWTERILPKDRRTRQLSVRATPEDQEHTKVIKQVSSAATDQEAVKLAIRQHSNRIQAMGERRDLLGDLREEFGAFEEDAIINAALRHLVESCQNARDAAEEYAPRKVKACCNTSVLRLKYRTDIESRWRG